MQGSRKRPRSGQRRELRLLVPRGAKLSLEGLPRWIRHLLDLIPVQIFIKEAQLDPVRGRRYFYLNEQARAILRWTPEAVTGKCDSDAFEGGTSNPEWQDMVRLESETIRRGYGSEEELKWTAQGNGAFRVNKAIQIPVLELGGESVVALCAVAQDFEFRSFQEANKLFARIMMHEYGNLCNSVASLIELAQRAPDRDTLLRYAVGRATCAKRQATAVFEALEHIDNGPTATVAELLGEVRAAFADVPLDLAICASDDAGQVFVRKPNVALSLLLELIRNAEKHTDDAHLRHHRAEVGLDVAVSGRTVKWTISNRCNVLKGHLRLATDGTASTFGGHILAELIERGYSVAPDKCVRFPSRPDKSGWVRVALTVPRGDVP